MRWSGVVLVLTWFGWRGRGEGARILGLFPHPEKSHFAMFSSLLEALVERGHELVVVSHFPRAEKLDNYTDISLAGVEGKLPMEDLSFFPFATLYWILDVYEGVFQVREFRMLLEGGEKFDLVLTEVFNTEMFLAVPYKLGAPFVGLSSRLPMPWLDHRAILSSEDTPFRRTKSTLGLLFGRLAHSLFLEPRSQRMVEAHLGPLPPLRRIASNTSLLFLNSHFALEKPLPLLPSVVQVPGLHIRSPKLLPQVCQIY
jgi:glucuronosyltransferase